ncbi:hypothetical protein HYQ46_005592 [Verticillium longisporum]|nr:hypothetical protein HYQ46_005592 [Verticillium longisporum]
MAAHQTSIYKQVFPPPVRLLPKLRLFDAHSNPNIIQHGHHCVRASSPAPPPQNYRVWKARMHQVLASQGLIDRLQGNDSYYDSSAQHLDALALQAAEQRAFALLLASISDQVLERLLYLGWSSGSRNASLLWKAVEELSARGML